MLVGAGIDAKLGVELSMSSSTRTYLFDFVVPR